MEKLQNTNKNAAQSVKPDDDSASTFRWAILFLFVLTVFLLSLTRLHTKTDLITLAFGLSIYTILAFIGGALTKRNQWLWKFFFGIAAVFTSSCLGALLGELIKINSWFLGAHVGFIFGIMGTLWLWKFFFEIAAIFTSTCLGALLSEFTINMWPPGAQMGFIFGIMGTLLMHFYKYVRQVS